jgi:import inner membrane translocase subunit TIM8
VLLTKPLPPAFPTQTSDARVEARVRQEFLETVAALLPNASALSFTHTYTLQQLKSYLATTTALTMDSLGGGLANVDLTKLSDRDKQELQQFAMNEGQKARIQSCMLCLSHPWKI